MVDGDLLINFRRVTLRRGGRVLVGPVDWQVELDERWVVIGPNGAGKTSLLRMAAAMEFPSSGTAVILGERLGRADMADLRQRIGLSSSALAQRIPDEEPVRDVVVSAGYAVLGRWREQYDVVDYLRALDTLESVGAEHLAERTYGTLSEGERKRVQAYEGVVIANRNRGLNSSFIVRKISSGEGVERTFQLYSPLIAGIEVKRRGDVRRAKLYFLRERSGKSARIKEKLS